MHYVISFVQHTFYGKQVEYGNNDCCTVALS